MFRQIHQIIQLNYPKQQIQGKFTHFHVLQSNQQHIIQTVKKSEVIVLSIPSILGPQIYSQITQISMKIKEQYKSYIPIIVEKKTGIRQNFEKYIGFTNIIQQQKSQIIHKQGQILLIQVWASWCGPCYSAIKKVNNLITNSNKCKDRVRLIGVNLDENINQALQVIKSEGWDHLQHLGLGKWDKQHNFIKKFDIQSIPFLCIVGPDGKVQFTGSPLVNNFEHKLQLILSKQSPLKNQFNTGLSKQQTKKILDTYSNQQWLNHNFKGSQYVSLKLQAISSFKDSPLHNQINLEVYASPKDIHYTNEIEKSFSKDVKLSIKFLEQQSVPDIPQVCYQCKKKLQYPFYWCKWNQSEFRCRQCIQTPNQQKYYSFLDNSILLMSKDFQKLPIANMGNNLQPKDISSIEQSHSFGCNGCGLSPQQIGIARYVCLNCKLGINYDDQYLDVCENCIKQYIQGQQQVTEQIEANGHKRHHSFVRILFNLKGYNQY